MSSTMKEQWHVLRLVARTLKQSGASIGRSLAAGSSGAAKDHKAGGAGGASSSTGPTAKALLSWIRYKAGSSKTVAVSRRTQR
jgi:hypothetical protein